MAQAGKSPVTVAAGLVEAHNFLTDDSDTIYRYNGAFWQELSKSSLRRIVFDADVLSRGTVKRRAEIVDIIKARSYVAGLQWGRVADYEVACLNGVVDVRTGRVRPHDPLDYLEKVIPWEYRPGAPAKRWLDALDFWFGEAQGGETTALQEFFGYCALSHAKYKKALVLYGESDTGKSIPLYAAQHLVGTKNCCSLPVDKMNDEQALAVLIGKSLNLLSELPAEAMIADGGFKQLVSTEEPVLINQKFKPPIMYTPTAKHVIATNALPRINDRSAGTLNRLLIVPMKRILTSEEMDDGLQDALLAEMQGILCWAIRGARRLVEQGGQFSSVRAGVALIAELRNEANPARDFIRERLVVDNGSALPLAQLVDRFNAWHKGSKRATTKGLGRMLRAAGQVIKDVRHGRTVVASLVGFRELDFAEVKPRLLAVDEMAIVSDAAEIEGWLPTKPGDPPPDEPRHPLSEDGRDA